MKKSWETIQKINGFKSGLENTINEQLLELGIDSEYEQSEIEYTVPATNHKYTPDFKLPNGIYIESKGRFLLEDRKKHLYIKEQNPELDIRFVFQNPKTKLYKGSKTTYAQWCDKHGFKWAAKTIPLDWIEEKK
jgi:hypothetical protein